MINLYHKVDGQEIERYNRKYTNFVSNSEGDFDWVGIFEKGGVKAKEFGEFRSDKI